MKGIKRIAIAGAGPAGLSAALFFAEQGHKVELFEKVGEIKPVGAGILLQPTGLHVLDCLGVRGEVIEYGDKVTLLQGETHRGRTVIDMDYRDLHAKAFGVGIHRHTLCGKLLKRVLANQLITLHLNLPISRYANKGKQVIIFSSDDRDLGVFDIFVVADGTHSQLQLQSPHLRISKIYPWGALWFIAKNTTQKNSHVLHQTYRYASKMLGLLPTGRLLDKPEHLTSFFWSLPISKIDEWQQSDVDFEQWKKSVVTLSPQAEFVMRQMPSKESLIYATYKDVVMRQWTDGRVVFIGDAAHGMSPQLGQGTNLALMDAWILSNSLSKTDCIDTAFANYNDLRKDHIRFYQMMSRFLTPFFQSNNLPYAIVRDIFSVYSAKIPFINKQMLGTLCGIQTGLFSRMDIEDYI